MNQGDIPKLIEHWRKAADEKINGKPFDNEPTWKNGCIAQLNDCADQLEAEWERIKAGVEQLSNFSHGLPKLIEQWRKCADLTGTKPFDNEPTWKNGYYQQRLSLSPTGGHIAMLNDCANQLEMEWQRIQAEIGRLEHTPHTEAYNYLAGWNEALHRALAICKGEK